MPANAAEVVAFVAHVQGLVDKDATMTLSNVAISVPGTSVTANLRGYTGASTTRIQWDENTSVGTIFSGDGLEQIVDFFRIYDSGRVRIPIFGTNHRFTPAV